MRFTRFLLLVFFLMLSFTWLFSSGVWEKLKAGKAASSPVEYDLSRPTYKKLQQKAVDAKLVIRQKGYNTSVCFLIDMSLHSGQGRFFV